MEMKEEKFPFIYLWKLQSLKLLRNDPLHQLFTALKACILWYEWGQD